MKKFLTYIVLSLIPLYTRGISLEECYELSRRNYPAIRQLGMIEKMKQFTFETAAKAYYPQIFLSATASWQNRVSEFPESLAEMMKAGGNEMEGLSKDQYKVMLSATQTIWDGGMSRARKRESEVESELDRLNVEKDLDAIELRVNSLYFGILLLDANISQLNDYMFLLDANWENVKAAVKNGAALQSDADKVEAEIIGIGQKKTSMEEARKIYVRLLSLMTAREISDTEEFLKPDIPLFPHVDNRWELKMIEARSSLIDAKKNVLNSSLTPRFDLFGQVYYGKPGFNLFDDMMYDRFSWNYVAGIRLQWSISGFYTYKKDSANLDLAKAREDNRRAEFAWNIDLEKARLEGEIAKMEKIAADDRRIAELRESIRMSSESKYRNGTITVNDLLSDIVKENDAKISMLTHELEMLKNVYELKSALNQ